jgi:hypothetical protein
LSLDPNDEIFSKAEARYRVERHRRSRLTKSAAFVGNLVISLIGQGPDAPIASQDRVSLIDRRTSAVVLTWGGSDLMPEQLLTEIGADLNGLSIRQFETKWGIGN